MRRVDSPPRSPKYDEALHRAKLALHNQRGNEAERIAREILGSVPDHYEGKQILGYALLMQGRAVEAIPPLSDLARTGRDPEIDTQLAIALRQTGRTDEALARLKRATKRRPPFSAAFHELGCQLYVLRRLDEAIGVVEQGVELAPIVPELLILLGNLYQARCDWNEAKAAIARALALAPHHPDAHYAMACVLAAGREFARAVDHLRSSLVGRPSDAQARLKLGTCLLELGQANAAMVSLRTATASGPQIYGKALQALVSSSHGRFWLRPSAAAKVFKGEKI
jgi:Flp pilus assembly protein TadD